MQSVKEINNFKKRVVTPTFYVMTKLDVTSLLNTQLASGCE